METPLPGVKTGNNSVSVINNYSTKLEVNNRGYLPSHEAAILSCLLLGGEYYLLFTSEWTNQWAWKALFTCVVYTYFWYKYSGLIFPYIGKIFYICDPAVSVVFSCSDPPLVMTYDFVIGLHSVWHVTKATAQVRLHFITNSSICFFKVWIFLYDFEHFLWLQRLIYFVLIFICTTAPSNLW